jgi:excisionase family DNA binding protein
MPIEIPPERQGLSVNETGALCGVAPKTIRAAVRCGQLPAFRLGRRIVIPKSVVERLLAGEVARMSQLRADDQQLVQAP